MNLYIMNITNYKGESIFLLSKEEKIKIIKKYRINEKKQRRKKEKNEEQQKSIIIDIEMGSFELEF